MSELQFLARRRREEMEKSAEARSEAGRRAHAKLARFYTDRLTEHWQTDKEDCLAHGITLRELLQDASQRRQYRRRISNWENEGGALR